MKIKVIRIESDFDVTKLLKKHPKYSLEYQLNINCQGYRYEQLQVFSPIFISIAVAGIAMGFLSQKLIGENTK